MINTNEDNNKKQYWQDLFVLYDKKHKGTITTQQLPKYLSSAGVVVDKKEIIEVTNKYNKTGEMTFDDVWNCFGNNDIITEDDIKEAFAVFDKGGKINKEELEYVLMNLGDKISEEEAKKFFSHFNIDDEGNIDYVEFLNKYGIH